MTSKLLIDGDLVAGADQIEVINPAFGTAFTTAPRADAAQVEAAIAAAKRAFPGWAALQTADRAARVDALATVIAQHSEAFVRLLVLENGKPREQAVGEVDGAIAALRYFAAQDLSPRILRDSAEELVVEQRYPLGVVAAVTPWNFPLILLILKIGPALLAGNTVIAKPAPTTPLTTLLLAELAAEVFPAGVLQTIVDQSDLGTLLTSHPDVAHVSFTGSTVTGRKVLASAASSLKRFTLELGGNDAAIVLDDVGVEKTAAAVFASAFVNAGQVCLATKRIYVPRGLADAFAEELARLADAAEVGEGLQQGTAVGPLQNEAQFRKVLGYIESAVGEGGKVLTRNHRMDGSGYFVRPTIVAGLSADARLVREEQFGPVVPVIPYDTEDEAIIMANSTEYGLGGSIWTANVDRGFEVASRIETGTIWVNRHLVLPFDIAFGGAKQSGIGLQQGIESIVDFTQRRVVSLSRSPI